MPVYRPQKNIAENALNYLSNKADDLPFNEMAYVPETEAAFNVMPAVEPWRNLNAIAGKIASTPGMEFVAPLQIRAFHGSPYKFSKFENKAIGTGEGKKLIPSGLKDLASEAKKYNTFEEFEKAFLGQIKHGTYYHITDNPNFTIDPKLGPRDMSSMAMGKMTPGKLMATSHLEHWASEYPERKYVAILDFSEVDPKSYFQVNRGFGNEFFVSDPSKVKVKKVVPIKEALKHDKKINKILENEITSSDKLRDFFNIVKQPE